MLQAYCFHQPAAPYYHPLNKTIWLSLHFLIGYYNFKHTHIHIFIHLHACATDPHFRETLAFMTGKVFKILLETLTALQICDIL